MHSTDSSLIIDEKFIEKFFPEANPSFIILFFSIKHLSRSSGECALSQIADFLNCMESDVVRAINFWEKSGILTATPISSKLNSFRFVFADSQEAGTQLSLAESEAATALAIPLPNAPAEAAAFSPAKASIAETRPNYSAKEIDFYLDNNEEIKSLFKFCQDQMGKLLSHNDMSAIFSFHDWLRLPMDVIELLVEYCCANSHRSIRYIEKVAVTWADAGIDTAEKAKQRIKLYNKDFRTIMSALGKAGREPTKPEEAFMIKWLKTFRLPLDIVLAACERTVLQASRPTFQYCDGIIDRWHTMSLQTLEEIEAAENDFKAEKAKSVKTNPSPKKKRAVASTKFSNFSERQNIDYAKLQQLEMARIDKELGKTQ